MVILCYCNDMSKGEDKPNFDIMNLEQASREELIYLATHDPLTNLLNRLGFEIELNKLAQAMPGNFSVLLMDLDGLKPINDEHGHEAGDMHLRKTAEIIGRRLRTHPQSDPEERRSRPEFTDIVTAARLGGDEFAVLLPGVDSQRKLDIIAQRIQRELSEENIEASMYGRPHSYEETADNLIVEVDLETIRQKEARKEERFNQLPWAKRRAAKVGNELIKFAGINPPRI